ncbi:MAG: MogA/MoaB family molybdenum cofactor biosynthesis protein [Planctomycetales bacterium]
MNDSVKQHSVTQHRAQSPDSVRLAVITVSDTRTLETDRGGQAVVDLAESAGHLIVSREIIPDEPKSMTELVSKLVGQTDVDAILMTGGTGISARDQTFETVSSLLARPLPGYGELFRMLSYQDIGAAAMLSRAIGGVAGDNTLLLTMPGSPAAVRLAMEKLILPEIGHLVSQAHS